MEIRFMRLFPRVAAFALALVLAPLLVGTAFAQKAPVYTGWFGNVAVGGYDSVAYFTQGKPVKGDARFRTTWRGAEFRFASAAHLKQFRADPARYAPQYGGYCAWAVAHGYTASGDPTVWKVVNGKLYLNYNAQVGRDWAKDIPRYIAAGDRNWPDVLAK
jgi:YHS domain-containing protein